MKLLIMQFSPISCHFISLRPKYSPQQLCNNNFASISLFLQTSNHVMSEAPCRNICGHMLVTLHAVYGEKKYLFHLYISYE
jgi:hypothetical protein